MIRTKILGSNSIQVASTLNNIGLVHQSKGQFDKALEYLNKCLEIQTKILGSNSIQVASTLNNIGVIYYNKGHFNKALECYNKCLEIRTKILGFDSTQVASTLENIRMVSQKKELLGNLSFANCIHIIFIFFWLNFWYNSPNAHFIIKKLVNNDKDRCEIKFGCLNNWMD